MLERDNRAVIVCLVRLNLCTPELRARLRQPEERTIMSMPETTMHEYDCSVAWKNNIRFAGKVSHMQPEPKAAAMQSGTDKLLGRGILASDSGHHSATRCCVDYISQNNSPRY
jgi:hypothetical protein